jgi:3D (Asp-Asp-Asp) domain-containing protein
VHDDGFSAIHTTLAATIGQALAGAGITVGQNDLVEPHPDSPLLPGAHVYITRARAVRLILESRERLVYTRAPTVLGLLREHGIEPLDSDRIFPTLNTPIRKGMTISFVSFRHGVEFADEPIPYATVYQDDPDLLEGESRIVSAGIAGFVRREYRITRLNGAETGRELLREIVFPASDEVIAIGTRPLSTPAPLLTMGGLTCAGVLNVYATYYTAASAGGGVTATGTGVYRGIVAVDPRVIPLGTRMWVPGYGYGLAADTGGAITGNIIDLGYGPDDVIDWTPHTLDICILP